MKKIKAAVILFVLFVNLGFVFAQTNADYMFSGMKHPSYDNSFAQIDGNVRTITIPSGTSIAEAAKKICEGLSNELDKTRALFTWIASNITYDVTFNTDTAYSAAGTWGKRCGVCQGYSLLYIEMAKAVGLNAEYVSGFSKSYGYKIGDSFGSHGWTMVHLSNRDLLLDVCWAAGYLNSSNRFVFDFQDCWFDVDPNLMIASHFPRQSKFQGLETLVTQNKFASLPNVEPSVSHAGMDGKEVFDFYENHNKAWFPDTMGAFASCMKKGYVINKLPLAETLMVGEAYTVNITVPNGYALAFVVDGGRINVPSGVDFQIKPATTKEVSLLAGYQTLLKWKVEEKTVVEQEVAVIEETTSEPENTGVVTTTTTSSGDVRVAEVTNATDTGNSTEVTNVPDDYVTPLYVPARVKAPIQTSKGFKNKLGMIFDPYAQVDFSKDGKIIGNVKVVFNKSGNMINFVDKSNAKKLYGQFLYKEQYWKKYSSELDNVILNLDQFYKSINIYQTDLYRDSKGNCVGPYCKEPNPTVTQAQLAAEQKKPNKEGLNSDNLSLMKFTCTDGSTQNNQANGKGKVLIFCKTQCGNCRATAKSIKNAGGNLGNVDVVEVEINMASKADVEKFKSECGADSIPFAYDTTGNSNRLMWNYLYKLGSLDSITLGVIVYIDANNKVQYVESGYVTADHIKQIVKDYL